MDLGASMPMRTLEPETSITSMTTSSPSMTFSPGRRVMMSMDGSSLEPWERSDRKSGRGRCSTLGRCLRRSREQRRANGSVRGLVDHLVAVTVCDQDRRAQVGAEVLQRLRGANRHVDHGHLGGGDADPVGLVIAELDLVGVEELPRVGQRKSELRVLERVQPHEGGLLVASQERVAAPAQADEAGRELDDGLGRHLDGAEPRRLERDGLGGHGLDCGLRYRKKSSSDGWMIDAPLRRAAW